MVLCDKKIKKIFNLSKFSDANYVRKDEIGISSKLGAELVVFDFLINDEPVNFTILDFNLPTLIYCIQFKFLSPFRIKFDESETRINEFGLDLKWTPNLKVLRPNIKKIEINGDVGELVLSLVLVMTFGSLVSIIFFIFELVWKKVCKNQDKIFLKHLKPKRPKNIRKIKVQCKNANV